MNAFRDVVHHLPIIPGVITHWVPELEPTFSRDPGQSPKEDLNVRVFHALEITLSHLKTGQAKRTPHLNNLIAIIEYKENLVIW